MTRKKIKFTVFLWHRRIGLTAFILVIILALTGIMLNHTEQLGLDEKYIDSHLVLNWYGLDPEGEPKSFRVRNHKVSVWDEQLFFDNEPVEHVTQFLRGAVWAEQLIVLAFDSEIILLTHDGELADRVPTSQSFTQIQRLGLKYNRPVIETSDPLYYMADEHILDWDVIINEGIEWSKPARLNATETDAIRQAFRGKGLNLERILLDLHSGRLFGHYGIYVMDGAAVALLWLSLSGLWVWWSRRVKQKRKKHYRKHHRK